MRPEGSVVILAQFLGSFCCPLDFGHDVPPTAEKNVTEFILLRLQVVRGYFPPTPPAQSCQGSFRLLAACPVLPVSQFVPDHGVGHQDAEITGVKGNQFGVLRLAVDEDEIVLLAESGGELVHDAAGYACEVVLRLLAEEGFLAGVEDGVDKAFHDGGKGQLEGSGGGESPADGQVADDDGVESRYGPASAETEALQDAPQVVGPGWRRWSLGAFQGDNGLLLSCRTDA